MPRRADTRGGFTNPNAAAHGAGYAAGWPNYSYWTGVADRTDGARLVDLYDGDADYWHGVGSVSYAVCRR